MGEPSRDLDVGAIGEAVVGEVDLPGFAIEARSSINEIAAARSLTDRTAMVKMHRLGLVDEHRRPCAVTWKVRDRDRPLLTG